MAEHHHGEPPQHVPGTMDITEQERTFEGFIRFWVILFGATAVILIFLALVAT
jgi:Bacterial aa3 type cytochrome c oxidase subunit IV